MVAKLRSGDKVQVIRGKDRGKQGTILRILPDDRVVVEGIQMVKKHIRAAQEGKESGIVAVEAPIHRSNVMLVDPKSGKPTRINVTVKKEVRDGKVKIVRTRVAKKSGEELANG